jgi:uncharacterized membrane protein
MKFLSVFKYFYIIFAIFFAYDVATKWNNDRNGAYLSLFFVVFAVFIFFFRSKYQKRFKDRGKL